MLHLATLSLLLIAQDPQAVLPADGQTIRASVTSQSLQNRTVVDAARERLFVGWESRRQERGSSGVYARAFDLGGRPLTHEMRVNSTLGGQQGRPAVAATADGTVWFAWESFGQDGSGAAVVARRFDQNLTPTGDELLLAMESAGDQSEPALVSGPDGAVFAVWNELAPASAGNDQPCAALRGRLLLPDGSLGAEIALTQPDGADDRLPAICALPDGYLLTWSRRDRAADRAQVWAQRLDGAGAARGESFVLDGEDRADQIEPSVDAAADGSFVAAWLRAQNGGWQVVCRRFDAAGAAIAPRLLVAGAQDGWKSGATVAVGATGAFAVSYNSERDAAAGETLWIARYDAAGLSLGVVGASSQSFGNQITTAAGNARRSVLTEEGVLAVSWSGDGGLGDETAAHVSLLSPMGLALGVASDLGVAQAAPLVDDEQLLAANPPIYDPNWVPQPPYSTNTPAGADFGFEGVPGTGWTPPDPEMAVGTNHIVVMTNGQIACFDKSGVNLWRDEIESNFGFWGAQGATGFVFDPEAKWDPHSQRYLAMACERSSNSRSMFLLAVSKDDSPTTAADWWKYRLDVTTLAGNDIDSPNMSVNADTILLTADFFSPTDKYLLYVIDKNSVLGGGVPVTASELITGARQQSMGIPVVYDASTVQYVLQSTELTNNNTVIFHAIQNAMSAYQRTTHTLSVPAYTYPNQPPQKGSSSRPFLFEPRFWSCAVRNDSLWAVHHVNSTRARARWYQFDLNGWPVSGTPPTLVQSGELDYGDSIHTFFPSIHVDADDNAAITFARSSPTEFISIGRALRAAGDPLGTFRPMQVVQTSDNAHTSGRWGDYSGTHADDAAGPGVFWGHHEFTSGSTSSWRTWVARYELDAAAFLLTVPPVITGGSSTTLTVAGATPGGNVQILYTMAGSGLTLLGQYGAYSSLNVPILGPIRQANAQGNASFTRGIPSVLSGKTFWFQVMETGRASNWEKRVIQ
jgi:hypothetical protein